MRRIGLTGGIATGKSTVATVLRGLGAPVIDADAVSRALTAPGGAALPALRASFGEAVFRGDALDRKALAARVFADADARRALEALLHPAVFAEIEARCEALDRAGHPIVVLEIPLLFETGYDAKVDEIWLTVLPGAEQVRRLTARDGLTEAEAAARVDSQWPEAAKRARAQVWIDTGRPPEAVTAQVRAAWEQTLRREQFTYAAKP
jgi:dephospho-CoA kinase